MGILGTRLKNKALQALYRPSKSSENSKSFEQLEKEVDSLVSVITGKKPEKKDEKKTEKDDETKEG